MTDLSTDFDALLSPHKTHISHHPHLSSDVLDQFLKEAYRINSHISSLHNYLLQIRSSYLSTSAPTRQNQARHKRTNSKDAERTYLSNTQRDAIDTESKATLRDLDTSIRQLNDVEKIRQDTEKQIAIKKYGKGGGIGGALGRWAAGGVSGGPAVTKSEEQLRDEERRSTFDAYRASVIWYLRQRLGQAAETQREMMERRVEREVEKSKSELWKVQGLAGVSKQEKTQFEPEHRGTVNGAVKTNGKFDPTTEGARISGLTEGEVADIEAKLSPEQLSLFAQENNEMLKRYEDTLDQIRTAERSMIEISELQSTLAINLEIQATRIDSMVEDASNTTTNVSGGNKQLQRATERFRPARMVFWASCGLCASLVFWDLIF